MAEMEAAGGAGRSLTGSLREPLPGNGLLKAVLFLFASSCIFDPADQVLGLKIPLFVACWLVVGALVLLERATTRVDRRLLCYILAFVAIPMLSILWYWLAQGGEPFEGWNLLKGYVLLSLAILLYVRRVDLVPLLSGLLTVLALVIIAAFIIMTVFPPAYAALHVFGQSTGIVFVDQRDYGGGLVMLQAYFVTSPMLVVAIAHYFHRAHTAPRHAQRIRHFLAVGINVAGMILAGTRNNLAVAILLPMVLHFMYARHKVVHAVCLLGFATVFAAVFAGQILQLLDPTETSNQLKLALAADYHALLDDVRTLLFGHGLGAYYYWDARGSYFYISELTYLEMVRNFGVFGAAGMFVLLVFPIFYAFFINRRYPDRHLIVAYAFYLLMCASNPNLFSSMGILILAVVLANLFNVETARESASGQSGHAGRIGYTPRL